MAVNKTGPSCDHSSLNGPRKPSRNDQKFDMSEAVKPSDDAARLRTSIGESLKLAQLRPGETQVQFSDRMGVTPLSLPSYEASVKQPRTHGCYGASDRPYRAWSERRVGVAGCRPHQLTSPCPTQAQLLHQALNLGARGNRSRPSSKACSPNSI